MYKTKIWIWLAMAVAAFLFWGVPKFFRVLSMEATPVTINIKTEDTILNETSSFSSYEDFTFKVGNKDSIVLVREDSDEEIAGYTKYDNLYYTPIVMFARYEAKEDNSGFKIVDSNSSYPAVTKDLRTFLDGILEGKEFKDIGISKDVATGKIKLYIPKKGTIYYQPVEDLIYLTLNDGKIPTEAQKTALKDKFDKIMNSCVEVEDIQQLLYDSYKEPSKHKDVTIVLGPEKIFIENDYYLSPSNSSDAWNIVYPSYTVAINYDVYVKPITDEKSEVQNEDVTNLLMSHIFSNSTGLRTEDGNFSFSSKIKSRSIDNLRIIY